MEIENSCKTEKLTQSIWMNYKHVTFKLQLKVVYKVCSFIEHKTDVSAKTDFYMLAKYLF